MKREYLVKIKVDLSDKLIEKQALVDNKDEMIDKISELICDVITNIINDYHNNIPIKNIESISWSMYNTVGKYIRGGRYDDLDENDPPVSFMTYLPIQIDEHLEMYHKAKEKARQLLIFAK